MRTLLAFLLLTAALPARAQQSLISTVTLTVEQLYNTTSLRDPMLPSTVYGDSKGGAKPRSAPAEVASSSFTIFGLTLTGIMEDSRGRMALLRDSRTGALYTLKSGSITDSRKKTVPGVSGVVKGKQVILMTSDNKINQLSLREKQ